MPAADRTGTAVTAGATFLVAFDVDGRHRWSTRRVGLRDVAPAFAPGLVLAATDDGLVAADRTTGTIRWDAALGDEASTPVVAGGLAITSLWHGGLVALRLGDGAVAWRVPLPGLALGPPAGDGRAIVATWEAEHGTAAGAIAVDVATGRARWKASLPPGGVSGPALVGGVVVMVAGDLAAHGLDVASGVERWRHDVGSAGSPEVPPAVAGSRVLVATRRGGLHLLDVLDGRERWSTADAGDAVRGGPVMAPGAGPVALPRWDGTVLVAGRGRSARTLRPPGTVSGLAVAPDGSLLVATRDADRNALVAYRGW